MLDAPYSITHDVKGRIKHLRSLLLIHSYLYYWRDSPIVSDDQWQSWANELYDVQSVFGCEIGWYDDAFNDWNGSTGYHLPVDQFVTSKVNQLRLSFPYYFN